MTVQRVQASVARGQSAAYIVQVSTKDGGSASHVIVALTSQPSSQKPLFTGGCGDSNGSASCPVSAVSDKQAVSLHAQIPVASDATSVSSVKLTATASITTSAKWTPPAAAVTVAVTAAAASGGGSPPSSSAPPAAPGTTLPLGPVPNLNSVSSSLIGAGNASELFPAISPGATPSPSPGNGTDRRNAAPAPGSSAIAFVQPGLTGQVAGLIALAVAVLLTVTRLSLRRRFRSRKQGS
ncbi:MAG TPA: hypothetical protein VFW50_15900 [Streptosporangiaceae bacterium]|nr:hypothetical protein [Streptosporangiaceae bacterium]